jgi:alcohol dehydrogenase class IV
VTEDFVWRDAGRTVVFRQGGIERAPGLLHEYGLGSFALLSTRRALAGASSLARAANEVHLVTGGPVPDLAAALLDPLGDADLVALGGGRVIDTAKAIASVSWARVAAIPTTLSGAEITGIHRLPAGAEDRAKGLVRPLLAIDDPELMTSLPERPLRASAMNALAHGADSLYTPFANPVSRMMALRGAQLIAHALDQDPGERDRSDLALGSVLCAYAVDSAGFAIHHVVCQTLVRLLGTPHAETNAAILPRSMALMAPRAPEMIAALGEAIGADSRGIEARLLELAGEPGPLHDLGHDHAHIEMALDAIMQRPELFHGPDPPRREEIEQLIESAW